MPVRSSKTAERSSWQKRSTDFQTLISVSSALQRSTAEVERSISRGDKYGLALAPMFSAMRRNEPIAFALNRGLVVIPGAERLWGNLLYCNWRFIQQSPYRARFPRHLPETVRYVKKYERERPNADDVGCL